jgi:DNA-binding response OmpR family regulator
MVRDALLERRHARLTVATSFWELCAISQQETFDIAILHDALSLRDVRSASEYVRRRWPRAKILIIHAETEALDDPLYDARMLPGLSQSILLAIIDQLTGG